MCKDNQDKGNAFCSVISGEVKTFNALASGVISVGIGLATMYIASPVAGLQAAGIAFVGLETGLTAVQVAANNACVGAAAAAFQGCSNRAQKCS